MAIYLNDILHMDNLENVKVRCNINSDSNDFDPLAFFQGGAEDKKRLVDGNFWNSPEKQWFSKGEVVIGLLRIKGDEWLLFYIGKITKDLHVYNGLGYEYETMTEYERYFGRTVVAYHKSSASPVFHAQTVFDECEVLEIRKDIFNNDIFPGYENVDVSWQELSRLVEKDSWKTALQNQKGVYLITDVATNKRYVGSATGEYMILGRWRDYIKNGHGGNAELEKLAQEKGFDYIKHNFRYAILDVFKSTIEEDVILGRESWWKETLLTRRDDYGYNRN